MLEVGIEEGCAYWDLYKFGRKSDGGREERMVLRETWILTATAPGDDGNDTIDAEDGIRREIC